MFTHFAPAEKTSQEILLRQKKLFTETPLLESILNAVPDIVIILNKHRQIVYSNKSLIDIVGEENIDQILGMRPGEALNCEHAFGDGNGCGTTEFCKTCGAVNAILTSQQGKPDVQECRIIQKDSLDALDLRIFTTPIELDGEQFTIFAVQDISHEKRRKALERIFFHDILNTAGVINGITNLLDDSEPAEIKKYAGFLKRSVKNLIEEVKGQRILTSAENGELMIRPSIFQSINLIEELIDDYRNLPFADNKKIRLDKKSADVTCYNDRTLIKRVIGNMLKNALEAAKENETVTLGCEKKDRTIEFWVHDAGFMEQEIILQVFQRSFSTKSNDRGLGTYSIKLLTEKYLKGKVWFSSSKETGTVFNISIPIEAN